MEQARQTQQPPQPAPLQARYGLRNCGKIMEQYGKDFFTEHIKASLDKYFSASTPDDVEKAMAVRGETFGKAAYPMFSVPDIGDKSGQGRVEVCSLGREYNVFRLAFLGMAWA